MVSCRELQNWVLGLSACAASGRSRSSERLTRRPGENRLGRSVIARMRTDQIETVVAGDMALAALRRRLYSLAFLWSLILLLGYRLLAAAWGPQFALRWVGLAALVLAYQHVQLARSLILNRRPGECELLSTYGVGNHLSMLRGLCIGLLAGFLFLERPPGGLAWAPVILYTSADLLDYFDGYLARITNHATQLGEALDLELDALGLLVAVSLAIWYGALPWWFAPFGLARYAFSFGLRLRGRLGLKTYPLPPSLSRRPIAGLAMGFMSAVLWPIVSQPATTIAGALFLAPFGASFLRDWLVVSGVLDPASERYHSLRRAVVTIATIWLPLPLRAALGVSVVSMAVSKLV